MRAPAVAPNPPPAAPARKMPVWSWLLLAYAATVGLHLYLLLPATKVAHIFVDELLYCMTGENIRWGHGYSFRGQFSSTVPPLEPLLVAATHSLGPDRRLWFFVASVLLMCGALIPAYRLAREFGLSPPQSAVFGLGVSFSPHTFYAATYMSETLQFPLFCLAFLLAVFWLKSPGPRMSLALGLTLGTMAMTRYATAMFWVVFVVVAIACTRRQPDRATRAAHFRQLLLVSFIYLLIQAGWWVFKLIHGASVLGAYGSAWKKLPALSVTLVAAYVGDALLAAGPLTPLPLLFGFRRSPNAATLAASTAAWLVLTTGIFDGGLTGEIRERYFLYALPLLTLLAAAGAPRAIEKLGRLKALVLTAVASLGCMALFLFHPFQASPTLGAPWAAFLGCFRIPDWSGMTSLTALTRSTWDGAFDPHTLAIHTSVWIGAAILVLGFCPAAARNIVLASALLLNLGALVGVARSFGDRAQIGRRSIEPAERALPSWVTPGTRVLIASLPLELEPDDDADRLGALSWAAGMSFDEMCRLETLRLLDVRIIHSPTQLTNPQLDGALLLTATPFPNLPLMSRSAAFYLYRLRLPSAAEGSAGFTPSYEVTLAPQLFTAGVAKRSPEGPIIGTGNGGGFLVFGPYRSLPRGHYRAKFRFRSGGPAEFLTDVTVGSTVVRAAKVNASEVPTFEFDADGKSLVEFRIAGPSRLDFRFDGVDLKDLSNGP